MIVKYFSSLRPGTVFCMVSIMGEKCVLTPDTQRKSIVKVTASIINVFIIDVL